MTRRVYLAFVEPDVAGGYSATFPDVPGAITCGETLHETISNAKDAVESVLDLMVEEGLALPVARAAEEILVEANRATIVAAIEAEVDAPSTRINVSIEERLLARIDKSAEQAGLSRSAFLAIAARAELLKRETEGAASPAEHGVGPGAPTHVSEDTRAWHAGLQNDLDVDFLLGNLLLHCKATLEDETAPMSPANAGRKLALVRSAR